MLPYFSLRPGPAFNHAAHVFLCFHRVTGFFFWLMNGWTDRWVGRWMSPYVFGRPVRLSAYRVNKVLKRRGCCIASGGLLWSNECGTDSNTRLHGVNRNGGWPTARWGKPLSFTDVIRIGMAKAVKWDNLENAGVSPATSGHYYAVKKKKKKNRRQDYLKADRVVDVGWPGCSLPIWQEQTDKGCCVRVTFPCVPIGMNNEGHSPCLSFNSIFTPCQIHLGAFHHHRSPSAGFSQ